MEEILYSTHTQTVYLNVNKPSVIPRNIRHWNISSTHGILPAIDPQDNATYLGTLPGRIVTVSMLHRSCHLQIMTALLLVWIYALYCRFPQTRQAISWLDVSSSSLLILVVLCYAYTDQFMLCGAMVAAAAIVCGGCLDVLGIFAVLTLARKGWYILAVILTVFYAVWAKDSRNVVPDFATFLARLKPALLAPNASETEERGCIACFLFEETLFELPCHPNHRACKTCLSNLHERGKSHCLHCSTLLFTDESRQNKVCIRNHIGANVILAVTFGSIVAALQNYKGYYWAATKMISIMLFFLPGTLWLLCWLRKEMSLAEVSIQTLWYVVGGAACLAWSAGTYVQVWDQVTLWDGAVLEGVEVWDTHAVVKEWYGAATSV